MCEKKDNNVLGTVFTVIGVITAIAAVAVAAYVLFKKYFKITFECDGDECDECDCNGCFIEKDDSDFEPVCTCDAEPEAE